MGSADLLLTDQVAIITGGGAGIGRAIALAFAKAGADIVIAEKIPERAEEAAQRVRDLGRRALAIPTDVLESDQIRAAVTRADETFGRIDILVNNAGGVAYNYFLEQSERSWRRHLEMNLFSVFVATAAAAPVMIRGGRGGSIINIATIEAVRAAPGVAVYAAAKAGTISFGQSMALELAPHGIRVNTITPDHTVTAGSRGNRTGPVDPSTWKERTTEATEAMRSIIPLGREGDAEECASAALFLASTMASYITGIVLPVDGGTSAAQGWLRTKEGIWALHDKLAVHPSKRGQ
jgi:NAD(P)-dependent dehydrogenase (short-subunit alcohol dehydrogenase family)